jgi:hypothetical protein
MSIKVQPLEAGACARVNEEQIRISTMTASLYGFEDTGIPPLKRAIVSVTEKASHKNPNGDPKTKSQQKNGASKDAGSWRVLRFL